MSPVDLLVFRYEIQSFVPNTRHSVCKRIYVTFILYESPMLASRYAYI
jgi:hypothetical protein